MAKPDSLTCSDVFGGEDASAMNTAWADGGTYDEHTRSLSLHVSGYICEESGPSHSSPEMKDCEKLPEESI